MATKKKIAAKTQPKRRPRSGVKPRTLERKINDIEVFLHNHITQLNADMHAEVGAIKGGNGKTDRLMAQNAQEFNILKSSVKLLQDHLDGTQSVLNHVDTRLRVLEQAAKDTTEPADCDTFSDKQDGPYQEKSRETRKISSRVAHSAILSRGLDRFLESLGFEVTE